MAEDILVNVITIVSLILLMGTFLLPKKIRYAFHSLALFSLGLIPLLHLFGVIDFTFSGEGLIRYIMTIVVVFTGRSLIVEGFHEEGAIRWVSVSIGVIIIVLTAIPTLFRLGALTFTIPEYDPLIDSFIYLGASILLFIGIFLSRSD